MAKALEAKEPEKSPEAAPKEDKGLPAPEATASTTAAAPASPGDAPGGEAPAVDGAPAPDAGGEMGGDFEAELQAAYAELDDEELCDHYMALKKELRQRLAADAGGAAAVPGAAPAAAPAPAPAMAMAEGSASVPASMSKAEGSASSMSKGSASGSSLDCAEGSSSSMEKSGSVGASHENGGEMKADKQFPTGGKAPDKEAFPEHPKGGAKIPSGGKAPNKEAEAVPEGGRLASVGKAKGADSPDRLEAVGHAKTEELEAKFDTLVKAVELLINTPVRKSVTDRFELKKNEVAAPKAMPLSKSQLKEKLVNLSKNEKLSASERDLINDYCYGNISADKLTDLVNKY
jgi:hypothetical protein